MIRNTIDWLLARRIMEQAGEDFGRKAADYMLERYRLYAPVDTGYMVGSAEVVKAAAGSQFHVIVKADYAQWVEFGHMTVAGTWVPPNPALRNAMADTASAFPQIARTVRIRRPESSGNESEGTIGSDVQHMGVSFDA